MWKRSGSHSRTQSHRREGDRVIGLGYRIGDPVPLPLPRRSEPEVIARWRGGKPLVSIVCPTYQHVDFIEDALRGFLGQDTDFPFEILVRDDASSDGTAEIVRDYAERFPNIIQSVIETENQWPQFHVLQILTPMIRGEYVAICEGDDYWIDPKFLAKAVARIRHEGARAAALVGRAYVVQGGFIVGLERPKQQKWNWYLPVRSLLYRSDIRIPRIEHAFGDNVLALELQRAGDIVHLDECVAVYRKHATGIVAGLSPADLRPSQAANYVSIAIHLARTGDLDRAVKYQDHAVQKIAWMLQDYGVIPKVPPSGVALALDRVLQRAWGAARAALRGR